MDAEAAQVLDKARMRAPDRRGVADLRATLDAGRDHEQRDRDADDVRAFHHRRRQRIAAEGDQPVRVRLEHMGAELRQLAGPAERAVVDLVPEHRIALRAHAQRDKDRQQVDREVRPRRGLDLGQHIAGERRLHLQRTLQQRARPAVLMHHLHAELGEGAVDQREIARRAVAHHHVAAGDRAQREESGDLVEIFLEGKLAPA
ncbi:hypothetical protein D3C81_1642570 [compost metagenome]